MRASVHALSFRLKFGWFVLAVIAATGCGIAEPSPPVSDAGMDVSAPDSGDMQQPRAEIGEPCEVKADCVEGGDCIGTRAGDFICMQTCEAAYSICDTGEVCLESTQGGRAICYTGGNLSPDAACAQNTDCGPGLLCVGASATFFCLDACSPGDSRGLCSDDEFCNALPYGGGVCRSRLGAGCTSGSCPDATMICTRDAAPEINEAFPGGFCTMFDCTEDAECPGESVCRPFPETSLSLCLDPCEARADCRFNDGYDCLDQSDCDTWTDPNACRSLFEQDRLCMPRQAI